jgi:hyperosmotically inducible protein
MSLQEAATGDSSPPAARTAIMLKSLRRSLGALIVLTLALSATPALAQDRTDGRIFQEISAAVTNYVHFTVFDDINASVEQGVVTLEGGVTMPYKSKDIERMVRKIRGVREVHNKIITLPVSQFDDELRFRIARAIYGSPSFWQYASMPNPPIHILVNRGHVTLSGVVQSNVERMLARSIASGYGAFSVKNELRTDAEAQAALQRF